MPEHGQKVNGKNTFTMQDAKEEILSRLDFRSYYADAVQDNLELGENLVRCPFHPDKSPSLTINTLSPGLWQCKKGCGEGDVFKFHQKKHGGEFLDALKHFAALTGVDLPSGKRGSSSPRGKKNHLQRAWETSRITDAIPPMGMEYLTGRGIRGETVEALWQSERMGFTFLAYRHPEKPKEPAIVFPLRDAGGDLIGIQNVFMDGQEPKKLNVKGSKESEAFFSPSVIPADEKPVVVTEAVIDAISVHDATGLASISIMSAASVKKLAKLKLKNPILFLDNDDAGKKGTEKALCILGGAKVVEYRNGFKDPNDILKAGHADEIRAMVEKAEPSEPAADAIDDDALKRAIVEELNRQYAVVMLGGKCRVMREYFDPVFGRLDIAFCGVADFKAYLANKVFVSKDSREGYANLWMKHEARRQYENIDFMPPRKDSDAETPPDFFNLWRGFGIKQKKGSWNLYEEHVFRNICNGNQEHFRWVMAWLARIVQDPGGERPGTAIVLMGRRGTGKSKFANTFGPIFGRHYLQMANQKHLTGNFNSHMKDKLVVFCDEGFWGGSKTDEGVLKALITEPTIPIEQKGIDLISVKNHVNLIMATNNEWVIPAGLEERRFFVTEVGEDNLQDKAFFGALSKQMENGGVEALFHDLLEWDDPDVNLREAPKTEALLSQIECSMNPLQKWWYQRLSDGENQEGTGQWYHEIEKQKLYQDYLNFAAKIGRTYFLTDIQFGMRLKKLAPLVSVRRDSHGSRPWVYIFADLDIHRKEFQDILRFELKW